MDWYLNLATRSKLAVGFGVMVALIIGLAGLSTLAFRATGEAERQFGDATEAATAALEVRADLNRIRGRMFESFVTSDLSEKAALRAEIAERIGEVWAKMEVLRGHAAERGDPRGQSAVEAIERALRVFLDGRAEVARLVQTDQMDAARAMLVGIQRERFEGLRASLIALRAALAEQADAALASSAEARRSAIWAALAVAMAAVLVALLMIRLMNRLLAAPVTAVAELAVRVAAGDLTVNIDASPRADEVGTMQRALKAMVDNLRASHRELQGGITILASSTSQILGTVTQVAGGASETAAAVAQTSTTAEEVRQTVELSSQRARRVQDAATRTTAISEAGRRAVAESAEGLGHIRQQMDSIADSVVRLSEQSQAIGEIMVTVNDLAEQSNLLAVNAAIEATRAGEYGKGFGVVAQEVRSLAEQSRQATTQVRAILLDVQRATTAAVLATEQGSRAVVGGVKRAREAGEAIDTLAGSVADSAHAATQIAASSEQQLVGIGQIAGALQSIRRATAQNSAGTRELETSAAALRDLGERIKGLADRQRVGD